MLNPKPCACSPLCPQPKPATFFNAIHQVQPPQIKRRRRRRRKRIRHWGDGMLPNLILSVWTIRESELNMDKEEEGCMKPWFLIHGSKLWEI
jgi:hypothetical protein